MINYLLIYSDWGLLALRVILGVVLLAHGLPKIKNIRGTAIWMGPLVGFKPAIFWAGAVAIIEFFGGIALILGLFTQAIALLIVIEFIVIIIRVNGKKGLVGGYELDLMILGASLALFTLGAGAISLDRTLGIFLY